MPYADPEEARSPPSSVADMSPRNSMVASPPPQSIDAVLGSDSGQVPSRTVSPQYQSDTFDSSYVTKPTDEAIHMTEDKIESRRRANSSCNTAKVMDVGGSDSTEKYELSAPVNVEDPLRVNHRTTKDATGRVILDNLKNPPKLQDVLSAPGVLDATRDMAEDETRAFISG